MATNLQVTGSTESPRNNTRQSERRYKRAGLQWGLKALALAVSALTLCFAVQQHAGWVPFKSRFLQNDSILAGYQCSHNYSIEILSLDPVVIYLNGFISNVEIEYLLDTYSSMYKPSRVYDSNGQPHVDTEYRLSKSARIPKEDTVSQCLASRMTSLLGNVQHEQVEPLQLVRYDPGDRFRLHYDWFPSHTSKKEITGNGTDRLYNRLSSIFVYLVDDCVGGETYFPEIQGVSAAADGEKFSRTDAGKGLLVKPKRGNAVFWNQIQMNGTGDPRVLHAGLPIKSGIKIGMNMFSTYYPDTPIVG